MHLRAEMCARVGMPVCAYSKHDCILDFNPINMVNHFGIPYALRHQDKLITQKNLDIVSYHRNVTFQRGMENNPKSREF